MIYGFVMSLISIYSWTLVIYILMSWFPGARESSIGRFLGSICEPYLEVFRRIIPPIGMLDISPIVAIFVLNFFIRTGVNVLFSWIVW
ncbi:YggT family protein [Paraliobacillus ryukyuensis]|uniref:YggT family protein n=1 Tax=Paraliobacillus ryukyuensis TaxID=200904 RepID=UPI0009A7E8F1|nr:YggT family protein [Paraliobacillus ryukyuensis]